MAFESTSEQEQVVGSLRAALESDRLPPASRERPRMSKLNTACSATEWWPIPKTMARFDLRDFFTSSRAWRRSSPTGSEERLILA